MKSRALRPPDIVLPPPFPAASMVSGRQQPHDHGLASPASVHTPGIRTTRVRPSSSINPAQNSPLPTSVSTKRARTTCLPVTAVLWGDVKTPAAVPRQKPMAVRSSSTSSSTDEESASEPDTPDSSRSSSPWTGIQDRILRLALDTHLSDPRTTPFAGSTPPATLLHRIAKAAVKLAIEHGADLMSGHTLADIRKRIVEINADDPPVVPTNSSFASPVLRNAGMGGIRFLTERAICTGVANDDSYFPLPLQSPFHESRNAIPDGGQRTPASAKRKFEELENDEREYLSF
ncbi:hypothetical protein POJ06DRAFT_260700 [Lipomyces tetrasporus]|uniref:Uncharacterized protein n=1 Tax=Lipomyces tetrasporus TaxID=54092 RepID=A0AAD7QML9_9ASCO|nr:uncharacterized protein POJ06DRAFT_260700 [Lipomyces tetrasporus]KAJ8098011.1 hypothetical protein POJ06DRAFT_260700 [Lipomyces tetrasporus]